MKEIPSKRTLESREKTLGRKPKMQNQRERTRESENEIENLKERTGEKGPGREIPRERTQEREGENWKAALIEKTREWERKTLSIL